jgi:putative membrane protein
MPDPRPADVLANERTYLAYVRTSLAFVAFGFVIARFALLSRESSAVVRFQHIPQAGTSLYFGFLMVLLGIVVGIVGSVRYARADRALREGRDAALSPTVAYIGGALLTLIGALVAFDLLRY